MINKITVNQNKVRVYSLNGLEWISFDKIGENDLYCGCCLSSVCMDRYQNQYRKLALKAIQ
jgi:hypothetical protein